MNKCFILHNIDVKTRKKEYLAPLYTFIPITEKLTKKICLDEKVLKGEYLSNKDYSSISGLIKGQKKCLILNQKINSIAVLNNYKEQRVRISKKNYYKNLETMLDKNILGKLRKGADNLIFTCFIDNPSSYNAKYYISESYHDLLDIMDILKKEFNFKNIYIVIKDIEKNSIEKFIKVFGNYPEINFITIPNIYPIDNTDYIEENLNIKNNCILTFKEYYQIFHIINHGCNYNEVFITFNVENKDPIIVKTKIGTLVKEIVVFLKIDYSNYHIYVNGPISGYQTEQMEDLIVSNDLESIIFTKQTLPKALKCLNCGNCFKYCPARINPLKNNKDNESSKCLDCGLCSYICPAYIDLRKKVKGENNK